MRPLARATSALIGAAALVLTAFGTASAADTTHRPPSKACGDQQTTMTILAFNDFHGRIATASPDTVAFFATLERERAAAGPNTLVVSSGDNIGATLFPSMVQADQPTIDILNAEQINASTVGNHELDRGWNDFAGRVQAAAHFPYLSANLYKKGTHQHATRPYQLFRVGGLTVALVSATTKDLPSLVGTEVFNSIDVGDPVTAVNEVTQQLKDGNPRNGEADVVIASYHEGAPIGNPATLAEAMAAGPNFADIVNRTDARVAAILTAHTHMAYTWDAPIPGRAGKTRPILESGSYAALIGKVTLKVDSSRAKHNSGQGRGSQNVRGTLCSYTQSNVAPVSSADAPALVEKYPRAKAVQTIVRDAIAQANVIGQQVVAKATAPITRGVNANGTKDNRAVESSMSNLVAQMFYDTLSGGDASFIGVQNPGGTRADFAAGDVTYAQAASVLPFANTLMTTQITGAQLKTMLEQQWQPAGSSRPFLRLGLSKNISYTYDESRAAGDRITSITVNGAPVDAATLYTVGSGSFLITGGDNFSVLAQGVNRKDTGKSDLDSWVSWLKAQATVSPDFSLRGVSVSPTPTTLAAGSSVTFAVGVPQGAALAKDTLVMSSDGAPAETTLTATLGGTAVGTASVVGGQVAQITVTVPAGTAKGAATLVLTAPAAGTVETIPVTIG